MKVVQVINVIRQVKVIDTHTGGEPTRLVLSGGPDLGNGPLSERRRIFRDEYDGFRNAVVGEPRGSDVFVGGILVKPVDHTATAGIVFFNNVGVLQMCGHGTIGLIASLLYLGRIQHGQHIIETPAGNIKAWLHEDGRVTITNVPSFRYRSNVVLDIPGEALVIGDIAWGGNWFFIVNEHEENISFQNIDRLSYLARTIREKLLHDGVTGIDGAQIDHVELFAKGSGEVDGKNFVLCPVDAYDRSPCGTGTSAKVACLIADNKLKEGVIWRQQSIVGSVFEVIGRRDKDNVITEITGEAFVNSEATLLLDSRDPFQMGIVTNQ